MSHQDPIPMTVVAGALVRHLREQAGLSLNGLARLCGTSPTNINRIERGTTTAHVFHLARIEQALREAESSGLARQLDLFRELARFRTELERRGVEISSERPAMNELEAHYEDWRRIVDGALHGQEPTAGSPPDILEFAAEPASSYQAAMPRRQAALHGVRCLVRALREYAGLSLAELGEAMTPKVHRSTLHELETASHRIPVDRLLDIEQALVSLGALRNTGELMRLVGEVVTLAGQEGGPGSQAEVEALVRGLLRRPESPA